MQRYAAGQAKARKKARRNFLPGFTLNFNIIQHTKESIMELKITGNPGTGNTFQEVHIGTVQNYNPNATTVINHNYDERHKAPAAVTPALPEADFTPLRDEVLHYVMKIQGCVSPQWAERYSTLWHQVLAAPEVEAVIYKPGKQQNTTFNRTLVANIIYIMCNEDVLVEKNATHLAIALEGSGEHPVRNQLSQYPSNGDITDKVLQLINPE